MRCSRGYATPPFRRAVAESACTLVEGSGGRQLDVARLRLFDLLLLEGAVGELEVLLAARDHDLLGEGGELLLLVHRHQLLELRLALLRALLGAVDLAHSARADPLFQRIAAAKGFVGIHPIQDAHSAGVGALTY